MKIYETPEFDILSVDCDIVTFSIGSLEDMPGDYETPAQDVGGGLWSW